MRVTGQRLFRGLLLASIYSLGILGIMASVHDDDDDDDDLVISEFYNFQLGGSLEGAAGNSFIDVVRVGGITVRVEPDLQGLLICDQDTEICELQFVFQGSSIAIDDQSMPEFVGDIEVTVEDDWMYSPLGTDRPVGGRYHVEEPGEPLIVVEFTDCQGSLDTEVQVTVDPSGPAETVSCYEWDNFEDLFASSGVVSERQASFAWETAEFLVLGQGLSVLDVFPLILDDAFDGGTSVFESCEIYPGVWQGAGEPGANPGGFTFDWLDDSGDSQIGSGDSFRQTFTECWIGDATEGAVFNGGIDYVGYTQVIQDQLLTRIGFEQAAQGSGKTGGVALDSLEIVETNQSGGDITPVPGITLNGRYLIVFSR